MPRSVLRPTLAAAALVALAVVAGCAPAPAPTSAPSGTSTPTPTATTAPAVLHPQGSAADNLPYFRGVVVAAAANGAGAAGQAYVDALVAAGFDRSQMQVTPDLTTIGNPAESVEFSVRWGADCLLGQVGPAIGEPQATVLPGLESGGCLLGTTRAIP